jgi:uncharacterized membrane protein
MSVKVLLAGESWVSTATHVKGFNHFSASEYQVGIAALQRALEGSDVELTHLPGHLVPTEFPSAYETLDRYDVVVLSDIGADSLLLHPDTFLRGRRTTNRLRLIADWVEAGGGFLMVGGYYSFQGINGAARWHKTPVEDALPVECLAVDDRIEVPEGFRAELVQPAHPILEGLAGDWPLLLGCNEVRVKERAGIDLLARLPSEEGGHPLLVTGSYGAGRTLAWTSDIGPHWLPEGFSAWEGYARLWRQALAWVTRTG